MSLQPWKEHNGDIPAAEEPTRDETEYLLISFCQIHLIVFDQNLFLRVNISLFYVEIGLPRSAVLDMIRPRTAPSAASCLRPRRSCPNTKYVATKATIQRPAVIAQLNCRGYAATRATRTTKDPSPRTSPAPAVSAARQVRKIKMLFVSTLKTASAVTIISFLPAPITLLVPIVVDFADTMTMTLVRIIGSVVMPAQSCDGVNSQFCFSYSTFS